MRAFKLVYLAIGLGLLAAVLVSIDVVSVMERVFQVGWGIAVVLGIYFVAFAVDCFTWQMALTEVSLNLRWLYRMWKVRMVGEVFNSVMPAAGMGGEPVKAGLLKRYYGIGYREGAASLIVAKTVNLTALVGFLVGGFTLMMGAPLLPPSYKAVAGLGLLALAVGTGLAFTVQRLKISSLAGSWISRWRLARRLDGMLHHVRDVEDRLVGFYTAHRGRFAAAVALALVNWLLGAVEIYFTMVFLGHPIGFTDSWLIEAVAQLVRIGTFFIPASIGATEGAFLLVFAAMTGSPALGVAVAVVRRFREVLWILWGVALGSMFSFQTRFADDRAAGPGELGEGR